MKQKANKYYSNGENLRFEPISAVEEKRLFRLAQSWKESEEGEKARAFLIENHLLWTLNYAKRLVKGKLPEDEVISAGNSALMLAVDRFKPEYGFRFRAYLGPCIRGAISRLWKSRNPVNYKDHFPEPDETGKYKEPLIELFVEHGFEEQDHENHLFSKLKECISELSPREQRLLQLIFEEGFNLAKVGRRAGTSRAAPHASFKRICRKLREALERRNITSSK